VVLRIDFVVELEAAEGDVGYDASQEEYDIQADLDVVLNFKALLGNLASIQIDPVNDLQPFDQVEGTRCIEENDGQVVQEGDDQDAVLLLQDGSLHMDEVDQVGDGFQEEVQEDESNVGLQDLVTVRIELVQGLLHCLGQGEKQAEVHGFDD